MIEDQLDKAIFADEQVQEHIIQELASRPDETLDETIRILKVAAKSRWGMAIKVIRAIGYPRNTKAIPQLIDQIGDLNSPAFQEAVQALNDMGVQVVVPHLIKVLGEKKPENGYWLDSIAGICSMLRSVDREYAVQCGPAIAYLLSQKIPEKELDPWYLLIVLEKIGSQCAIYALPSLIQLAREGETSETRKQARDLIMLFDPAEREPYKYLLADL
jgi:hypothetical protein